MERALSKLYLKRRGNKLKISIQKRVDKVKGLFANRQLRRDGEIAFKRDGAPRHVGEDGITVILNMYGRPEYLYSQVEAIKSQSAPANEIWIWSNKSEKPQYDVSALCDRFIVSNYNWKFFGRFAMALMAQTKYVALFDDDVLPCRRWLENCLHTAKQPQTNGILGGSGVHLPLAGGYGPNTRFGWHGPHNDTVQEVDLVGHAWFMEKKFLLPMWREEPFSFDNGEDIHLSYTAQKYGGIKTFVPPHPINEPDLWSSDPIVARVRGCDKFAHSIVHQQKHDKDRDDIVNYYRANGWKIISANKAAG